MAKNLELIRQAIEGIRTETEDYANTAERVGGAIGDVLEYSEEQRGILASEVAKFAGWDEMLLTGLLLDKTDKVRKEFDAYVYGAVAITMQTSTTAGGRIVYVNNMNTDNPMMSTFAYEVDGRYYNAAKINGEMILDEYRDPATFLPYMDRVYVRNGVPYLYLGEGMKLMRLVGIELDEKGKRLADVEQKARMTGSNLEELTEHVDSISEDVNVNSGDISRLEETIEKRTNALSVEITEAENRVSEEVMKVRDNLEKEVERAMRAENNLGDAIIELGTRVDVIENKEVELTQAKFDELKAQGMIDESKTYYITEEKV